MIRRLGQIRLRLIDTVIIAAVAMLGLKVAGFVAGGPGERGRDQAGSGNLAPGEQLPSFARVLANARTNYVPPDVSMTGAVPDKNEGAPTDKKDGKEATPDKTRGRRLPADGAPSGSPAERAVLERLGERRDEIQKKGLELDVRERLLENAERKLDSRINELKTLEDKSQEPGAKKADAENAGLRNLVTMYEAMKPKDAARVFDRLTHDVLVPVVLQMNPRKMAEVLAVMSPEAAEKLTVALATRGRPGNEPRGPATPAGNLPAGELPAIDIQPTAAR